MIFQNISLDDIDTIVKLFLLLIWFLSILVVSRWQAIYRDWDFSYKIILIFTSLLLGISYAIRVVIWNIYGLYMGDWIYYRDWFLINFILIPIIDIFVASILVIKLMKQNFKNSMKFSSIVVAIVNLIIKPIIIIYYIILLMNNYDYIPWLF